MWNGRLIPVELEAETVEFFDLIGVCFKLSISNSMNALLGSSIWASLNGCICVTCASHSLQIFCGISTTLVSTFSALCICNHHVIICTYPWAVIMCTCERCMFSSFVLCISSWNTDSDPICCLKLFLPEITELRCHRPMIVFQDPLRAAFVRLVHSGQVQVSKRAANVNNWSSQHRMNHVWYNLYIYSDTFRAVGMKSVYC
jgi:hypothetical protein